MRKVLIVDDDPNISELLRLYFEKDGFSVANCLDGELAYPAFLESNPDIVILDLMLPGIDGIAVCKELRSDSALPILILTAKDATQDRVLGLDAGADDYMVKPFELEELLARVRALLRRTQSDRATMLSFADLTLDTSTRLATRGSRTIQLTATEFDLLELFLRHPHQVLTREVIFDRIWGYDFGGESNVLDVYIRYLRQKLEENGEPRLIQTARGVGYALREET